MKLNHQLTPYTKINSKWIKDLNIIYDTIKVLEEDIGSKISNIPCGNMFTNISSRARERRERLSKLDYIKLKKNFCMAKENIMKMKWEQNIFANETAKDLNRHFSKDSIQRAQRHMKGYSTSLAIREMQIKTTMRYHLIPA